MNAFAGAHRNTPARIAVVIAMLVGMLAAGLPAVAGSAAAGETSSAATGSAGHGRGPTSYENPILPRIPGDGAVESCADPTVLRGQQKGDRYWYMYCTTDPLNDEDLDAAGDLRFHRIPTMRSLDLVNWTYVGDAFDSLPAWAAPTAALWAPDVVYSSTFRQYYMTFVVTDTADAVSGVPGCDSDNAIGVATGPTPTGPWTFSDAPVVGPRSGGEGCNFLWTFDPEVPGDTIGAAGHLFYGSYYGGIYVDDLTLTATGATVGGDPTMVAIDNKYEGANVVKRDGYYYLFVSAANCCNGALTGYSVFAGRSRSIEGPYLDREGNSLLDARAGGTPVISMNGNRWVGTGHNSVFKDFDGQWWTMYHAVDREDPFFDTGPLLETELGFTKRPALLDPIDWVKGWPTVRGGQWASDSRMPAPAAQPGQDSRYRTTLVRPQLPGKLQARYSDDFNDGLDRAWSWVRPPAAGSYSVTNGVLTLPIQKAELYQDDNTASVLLRNQPRGDYVFQAKVRVDVPDEGCCFNFAQAGIIVYGDDNNFVKLTNTSIWNTRQTEFAKEQFPVPTGWARYGNSVVGPPSADWTYLRIVVETLRGKDRAAALGDTERYTAYTSQDGRHWVRGGAWTHTLGADARIGLVAMGQQPATVGTFTAEFDDVRVSTLRTGGPRG
ncbi:family 43 glycosylhydrolase [Nakamurella sp. GG22]